MPELEIEFAGIPFKNPVVAAAGPITSTPYTIGRCIESGAGAVIVKSVGLDPENQCLPRPGNWFLDRLGERGGLMHYFAGLLSPDQAAEYIETSRPLAEKENARLIGSFFFIGPWTGLSPFQPVSPPADVPLREMAKKLEAAGADAIEVCCSCGLSLDPTHSVHFQELAIPLVLKALEGHLNVPYWIKLGFGHDVFWLRDVKNMESHGVASVHAYSDFRVTFLDVETGKPPLSVPFGYGRWMRGLACYAAFLSARRSRLQVMSSGGIWTWKDAVERMMCGATLAALESAVQYRGYRIFEEIIQGMGRFMDRKGYRRPAELVGLAVPHIYNVKEFIEAYHRSTVPPQALRVVLDEEKCTGCGLCSACIYGAIVMENGVPRIDTGVCERCGACVTICPTEALGILDTA
jgi:dihydropyrimidine dehydrogenase (NAD+) subunit PreA